MKKILGFLKPFVIGSLGMAAFTVFTVILCLLISDHRVVYFSCGIIGAFGMGYYIHRLVQPISSLTVIIIIPCLFSGIFIGDYINLTREPIIYNVNPSEIKEYQSAVLFELSDFKIIDEMQRSCTRTWRYKDKSADITVHIVPIVDSDWQAPTAIEVFAVCDQTYNNCDHGFSLDQRFARLLSSKNENHYQSFEACVKDSANEHDFISADKAIYIELIADIQVYAKNKLRIGIAIFIGLLLFWNIVAYWLYRQTKK